MHHVAILDSIQFDIYNVLFIIKIADKMHEHDTRCPYVLYDNFTCRVHYWCEIFPRWMQQSSERI